MALSVKCCFRSFQYIAKKSCLQKNEKGHSRLRLLKKCCLQNTRKNYTLTVTGKQYLSKHGNSIYFTQTKNRYGKQLILNNYCIYYVLYVNFLNIALSQYVPILIKYLPTFPRHTLGVWGLFALKKNLALKMFAELFPLSCSKSSQFCFLILLFKLLSSA